MDFVDWEKNWRGGTAARVAHCTGVGVMLVAIGMGSPGASSAAPTTCRVFPPVVVSKDIVDLEFSFELGARVEAGDELHVEIPYSFTGENRDDMWEGAQVGDSLAGGYVRVDPVPGAILEPIAIHGSVLGCRLTTGSLDEGALVVVRYRGRAQSAANRFAFRARERRGDVYDVVDVGPDLAVLGGPAHVVRLITPADVGVDEPFSASIVALDPFGNVDIGFAGAVDVSFEGGSAFDHVFTSADSGRRVFDDLWVAEPGTVHPELQADGLDCRTAPMNVFGDPPQWRRFFGDTHFHTGRGNGYRGWIPPGGFVSGGDHRGNFTRDGQAYRYVRDVAGLDWASASEHDVADVEPGILPSDWEASQDVADGYYQPGVFTTFFAWEWTNWLEGHRVVYYRDRGAPVLHRRDERYDTIERLTAGLRSLPVPSLVIPHVMEPDDDHGIWRIPRNGFQRVGEIYSHHNDDRGDDVVDLFEMGRDDPWSYRYAWATGHRMGLIASSDDHFGMPGRDAYSEEAEGAGGLAVALAASNDREGIWDALMSRRTYATTGARILLDFQVDGAVMGSALSCGPEGPYLEVAVAGTSPVDRIEVVRGQDGRYRTWSLDGLGQWSVEAQGRDDGIHPPAMYYVRVVQEDGEMAWSSPVWITGIR